MDCLFCKIINGEIPSNKIFEDEYCIAFEDINAQAPVHFLVVPKEHISSINQISGKDKELIGHVFLTIKNLAEDLNLKDGYRIVNNCGKDGGQTVDHIHFHVLGKREMLWPPG